MRKILLALIIILVGFIFIGRLFYLQVYSDHETSILDDNAIRKVYEYPKRGFVFDRHGTLLVSNQPTYDVMLIPREVKPFDTLEFCNLLKIDKMGNNILYMYLNLLDSQYLLPQFYLLTLIHSPYQNRAIYLSK